MFLYIYANVLLLLRKDTLSKASFFVIEFVDFDDEKCRFALSKLPISLTKIENLQIPLHFYVKLYV